MQCSCSVARLSESAVRPREWSRGTRRPSLDPMDQSYSEAEPDLPWPSRECCGPSAVLSGAVPDCLHRRTAVQKPSEDRPRWEEALSATTTTSYSCRHRQVHCHNYPPERSGRFLVRSTELQGRYLVV